MADDNTTPNPEQPVEQAASVTQDQQPVQEQPVEQPASATQDQQSPQGFVPPTGQVPPQQPNPPFTHAASPQNLPGMPLLHLTGGMKFGWAVVGFFMGPIAILIAWLTNAHNFPQAKSEAVKFSLIGFLASIVVVLLLLVLVGFAACSAISSMTSSYYHYYY